MNAPLQQSLQPVVRKNLDFKLDEIPRFWFGGDAFKTRVFDALSLTFPDGERYFIQCVRLFRDQIQDPHLANRVTEFIQQEAQHGIAHDKMNQILINQGMPVDKFIHQVNQRFKHALKRYPKSFNIAITAACEHLTALMASTFFSNKATMQDAHPYIRALFAWHSIEEMEHRDVAFDVMQNVAKTSNASRYLALTLVTLMMFGFTMQRTNGLLKQDGFTRIQRMKMFHSGLKWLLGRQGILTVKKEEYLDWYRSDFHPSQHAVIAQYDIWIETLLETNDPIAAGQALWKAASS
ncbi:metal-dependent hydrolase [Acinetobacter shaoyimingii]|uniref:Metal-dependent hydrolase n=1 Tax=Acinetobacter shaoyimingii TaxID=2715164 RepID=A0A6G8RTH8_9GAMM|nr:metal-dependent hydrolase [Acinetobacter shaoyimingii]NHB59257.1 metal-dependent hydrolase [Acinetobacter shaoyimingii]QIO05130.1 metal-dependent hydrolase [Acinetobacter shaoyimingii]